MKRKVIPLSGPSSVYMALMASGIQGQRFMFHGYIPVKKEERVRYLREMEQRIKKDMATQIFMETPYRNNSLMEELVNSCNSALMLSVSAGLESDTAFTATRSIGEWKKELPDLHKIPAVFVMGI
jgi:16S rRNA (cytidine1402-2'-O)-methyltransferase